MRKVKPILNAVLRPLDKSMLDNIGEPRVRLPSTIQAALLDLGLIEDPYFKDNFGGIDWISRSFWEYRFEVDSEFGGYLLFHGVDYRCIIKVDGVEVFRHVGMFSPFKIPIKPGHHVVSVVVYPNDPEGRRVIRPPNYGLKRDFRFSMSYGWDFAPRILTLGIWDKVEFVETNGVFVSDIHIDSRNNNVDVSFVVDGAEKGDTIELFVENSQGIVGSAKHFWNPKNQYSVVVEDYEEWFPWDLGEPVMYYLCVVWRRNGEILDEVVIPFGFANISFRRGNLFVNGERVAIRGANWVPMDSLLRFSVDRYRSLMLQAKKAGINLLRVWGGGLREWREFYDLADRLGILIWQEFPIACEYIEQSPQTLRIIEQEVRSIVNYLRNHPSIAIFSGGNEHPLKYHKNIVRMISEIVELHSSKPFIAGSPSRFDTHAWYVWHGLASIYTYILEEAEIISEFGLQAIPQEETLRKFLGNTISPSSVWQIHNFESLKHYHYLTGGFRNSTKAIITAILGALSRVLRRDIPLRILGGLPLKNIVFMSQYIQALGLKLAIETCRVRGKGCILWQFNEPWPAITWSIIDYFGNRKLAYDFVAMSYSPVQVFLVPKRDHYASIILVNDTRNNIRSRVVIKERNKIIFVGNRVVSRGSRVYLGEIRVAEMSHYRTLVQMENNRVIRNYYPPYSLGLPNLVDRLIYRLAKMSERILYQL